MGEPIERRRFLWPQELFFWAYVLSVLVIALVVRLTIFGSSHEEGDEVIYRVLTDQLINGQGYTLQGHPILQEPWIAKSVYDTPIFFHPPVGILFFSLCELLFGRTVFGLCVAQIILFVVFFVCSLFTIKILFPKQNDGLKFFMPLMIAFTPIFAHTNTKIWIDNPKVTFLSMHFFFTLLLVKRPNAIWLFVLTAISSFATVLTKIDGFYVLPFAYLFALSVSPKVKPIVKKLKAFFVLLLIVNFLIAMTWLWGSEALKYLRPSPDLLAKNSFVRFIILETTSFDLIANFFKVVSSVLPAIVVLLFSFPKSDLQSDGIKSWVALVKNPRGVLLLWIFSQCTLYFILGFQGYPKVLRYLSFCIPATFLLFAFAINDLGLMFEGWSGRNGKSKGLLVAVSILLFVSFNLEIAQGLNALLFQNQSALILPVF